MSINSKVCIAIPVYKERLDNNEKIAWNRCLDLYGSTKIDIYLICPSSLKLENYQLDEIKSVVFFSDSYFKSPLSYNRLLLHPNFYKSFLFYDSLMIYQLDGFIWSDKLLEMVSLGYDFIGAPWIEKKWVSILNRKYRTNFFTNFFSTGANGGVSLRKVKPAYRIAFWLQPFIQLFWKENWNEDMFWSTICSKFIPGYKLAPINRCLAFAFEDKPEKCFELNNNKLPFTCHAWEKFNPEFWAQHFESLDIEPSLPNKSSR